MSDNHDEIEEKLKAIADKYASVSQEIADLEQCFGVRITIEITNLMGMVQVGIDVKTSGEKSLKKTLPDEVKKAIRQLAESLGEDPEEKLAKAGGETVGKDEVEKLFAKMNCKTQEEKAPEAKPAEAKPAEAPKTDPPAK